MAFVLTLVDLGIWFGVFSMVMLAASELVSSYYGRVKILIELKKLRKVGMAFGLAFIFTVAIMVTALISTSP